MRALAAALFLALAACGAEPPLSSFERALAAMPEGQRALALRVQAKWRIDAPGIGSNLTLAALDPADCAELRRQIGAGGWPLWARDRAAYCGDAGGTHFGYLGRAERIGAGVFRASLVRPGQIACYGIGIVTQGTPRGAFEAIARLDCADRAVIEAAFSHPTPHQGRVEAVLPSGAVLIAEVIDLRGAPSVYSF